MEANYRQNGKRGNPRRRTIKTPPRPRPASMQRWWWWAWGDNQRGRRVALGPHRSQAEAEEMSFTAYPNGCRIYMLDTQNLTSAKTKLKAIDIKEGRTIDEAMRRASSKLP